MTPDWPRSPTGVPYATFSDPQSLDLYNYTLGNPETNADPDGHWCFLGIGTTCPPSRTSSSGVGGDGPGAFGPRWFQECEADLQCGSMNVWPFLESGVGQAQFDLKHPYIGGALMAASLFAPELLDGGEAAGTEAGSTYFEYVTRPGAGEINVQAELTPEEFGKSLEDNGYAKKSLGRGVVQYTNGTRTYTV